MTISSNIRNLVALVPTREDVTNNKSRENLGKVTEAYQRWFELLQININDMISRGSDGILLNPDFNWSRVKGNNPTTQADGNDAQFVEQWAITGDTNTYTITPTNYSNTATNNATGSTRFVNFDITDLPDLLTLYNINYAPQFNAAQKLQNNTVTLSLRINNNTLESFQTRFLIEIEGIANEYLGQALTIQPGLQTLWTNIQVPSLQDTTAATNAYAKIKLNIERLGISGTANFDIQYIKAEIASYPTRPEINHIQQVVSIDALNAL